MDKPHRQYEQGSQKSDQPKSPANLKDLSGRAISNTEMPVKTFSPLKALRHELIEWPQWLQGKQKDLKQYTETEKSRQSRDAIFQCLEQASTVSITRFVRRVVKGITGEKIPPHYQ